ncbi:MAG: YfhO family protein [Chloroflexia bacterium]
MKSTWRAMLPNLKSAIRNPQSAIPLLLLLLALIFMSPGLPPFRVAAPMDQLLIFPPWHSVFPDVEARLRGSDILFQQLPWHHWMQDELKAGRFPLWASGPLGGYPLFANYQVGVLSPLHLLWALMPTGAGFGLILALKLWIAGLGMWLFLRALNLHWSASLLGALGFMFSASLIVWLPWSHTNSSILLPWLCLAAYEWCIHRKKGALAAFAFLWVCCLVGGTPEFFFIVAVCVGIWMLGLVLSSAPRKWVWQVGGLTLSVVVGTLLGAIQLLPFFETLGISHIATLRPVDVQAALERAREHLDAGMILNWVEPRWWGQVYDGVLGGKIPNESNGYAGQVALLGLPMLAIGLFRRKVNLRFALPWLVVVLLCWIVVYDDALGTWIRSLPGFSQMVNFRFLLGISFGLPVLGALGWDWFARGLAGDEGRRTKDEGQPPSRFTFTVLRQPFRVLGILLVFLSAAFLMAHWLGVVPHPDVGMRPGMPILGLLFPPNTDYRLYWTSWELGVLTGILGATLAWWTVDGGRWTVDDKEAPTDDHPPSTVYHLPSTVYRPPSALWPLAIGAFLVADLWQLMYTYNPTAPAAWYYPQTSFIQQVVSIVPPAERLIAEGEGLLSNTGLVYGYRDWRAQEPMFTRRALRASVLLDPDYRSDPWNRYNMSLHGMRLQVAPMFGIRYFVFPTGIDPNHPEVEDPGRPPFKRLAFTEGLGLWEAEGVPGFAYLSDNVEAVPDDVVAREWMGNLTWEQTRAYAALVEASPAVIAGIQRAPDGSSPGSVSVLEYTPGHIRLEVDAHRPSLLVVSESHYPGWHASMDNQPVEILHTNYLSQGIVVPAGKHAIVMKYEPDSFRNGAILSLVGLAGLAGLLIWSRRSSR